ncbi:MAG: hypothetical protein ACRC3Y_06920 [Romboutsia sp.]|uniref:hypothetical protein n=1 Tax=Romboutsia sp. TaxID=1965302 RepID=UPI003F3FB7F2
MGQIIKTLYSIDYPEVKTQTCVTGWTWIPCPTATNWTKQCKQEIKAPCVKTKTSRFRVYVRLTYPDTLQDAIKRQIDSCHAVAFGIASGIIISAATAPAITGPQSAIAAAIAAVPAAAKAYSDSFYTCLTTYNISSAIKNQIKGNIIYDTVTIKDWRKYNIQPADQD